MEAGHSKGRLEIVRFHLPETELSDTAPVSVNSVQKRIRKYVFFGGNIE